MPHRHLPTRRALVLVAAVAMLLSLFRIGGAAAETGAEQASPQAQAVKYDGETLFRGLFFGQGEVAAKHPNLTPKAKIDAAGAKVLDKLVAQMKKQDAGFFASFADLVQSGDRVAIQQGIRAGVVLLKEASTTLYGPNAIKRADGLGSAQCIAVVIVIAAAGVLVLAAVGAGLVTYATAINVNINVNYNYSYNMTQTRGVVSSGNAELREEQWIDQIAVELAA